MPAEVRGTGSHWLEHNGVRNRCAWCSSQGERRDTNFSCATCKEEGHPGVFLCVRECARRYHGGEDFSSDEDSSASMDEMPSRRKRGITVPEDIRTSGAHWPQYHKDYYRACSLCNSKSHYTCRTCAKADADYKGIFLCAGKCFREYHTCSA